MSELRPESDDRGDEPAGRAELLEQIHALLERRLSAPDAEALKERLRRDEAARRLYVQTMEVYAGLKWRFSNGASAAGDPARPLHVDSARAAAQRGTDRQLRWAALAAAVVVIGVLAAVWIVVLSGGPGTAPGVEREPVGVVIAADDVGWVSDPLTPGDDLTARRIASARGSYEFQLTSGATVRVDGAAAEMVVLDPMRVRLMRGRASFVCPPEAAGFTVVTERGVWVRDLGTAFDVGVEPTGAVRIDVGQGRVEVGLPESAASGPGKPRSVELTAGQIAVVDVTAEASDAGKRLALRRLDADDAAALDAHGVTQIDWPTEGTDAARFVAVSRHDAAAEAPDPAIFTGVTDGVIRVSSAAPHTWGSVWLRRKASVADGFEARFAFEFAMPSEWGGGNVGADGLSFVLHDHADGKRLIVGEQGNDVEFGRTVGRALALEFDSYQNGAGWEPSHAHVSLRHGDTLLAQADLAALEPRIEDLSGSGVHEVVVRYEGGRMSVEFDGRLLFDGVEVDLRELGAADASGRAWVGFGARTGGGAGEHHDVRKWTLKTTRP